MNQKPLTSFPAFQIIPAADLFEGKIVRLYQGKYDQITVYDQEPISRIKKFVEAGVNLIHIVDLSAARDGKISSSNQKAILSICKSFQNTQNLKIQIGGGIREMDVLKRYFGLGISRCIIGTASIQNPDFLNKALYLYGPEKILCSVDVLNQMVRVSGWEQSSGILASDLLKQLEKIGIQEVIYTDISRDGTLKGPGNGLSPHLQNCQLDFILSGGISSLEDIQDLLKKRHPRLKGAITGKAIYEGKLDLKKVVQLCTS